jgi:hypothetical protein
MACPYRIVDRAGLLVKVINDWMTINSQRLIMWLIIRGRRRGLGAGGSKTSDGWRVTSDKQATTVSDILTAGPQPLRRWQ